jgi:hypothetical protein
VVSFSYELVLSLDLKDGLTTSGLDEVSWLFGIDAPRNNINAERGWRMPERDVAPRMPGGEFTRFEREFRFDTPAGPAFAQALFVRRQLSDDEFADCITPLLEWVAEVAANGYVGFFRAEQSLVPTALVVRNGHAYVNAEDGSFGPATIGAPPFR